MKKKLFFNFSYLFVIIILSFFMSGCNQKAKTSLDNNTKYNLLFISIDTLRADHLGCYGYKNAQTPNIDNIAKNGVRFENCYSPIPLTLPAHCSIFTGKTPNTHKVKNNGGYFLDNNEFTLAELMKTNNYNTYAVISSFVLHSKFGLNQGFDKYDDSLDLSKMAGRHNVEIGADIVYNKFSNWLNNNKEKKFFSWIHFYDPHFPYNPPGEFKKKFKNNPYDGEIAYVDYYIGRIVEDLKKNKILNKTLIIITGDHGEAFGEHKESGHGVFCYNTTLKVPLIFYNPTAFTKSRTVLNRVNLTEIMPTVVELFNLTQDKTLSKGSFASQLFNKIDRKDSLTYFESIFGKEEMNWAPLTGIIYEDFKYISLPKAELYDLKKDPEENNNLYKKKNRIAKQLDKKLKSFLLLKTVTGVSSKRNMSKDDLKKLESLGYISPSSQKSKILVDPKTGIELINKLESIKKAIINNDLIKAENMLKEVSSNKDALQNPKFFDTNLLYYLKKGDNKGIQSQFHQAIKRFPEIRRFRENLALYYLNIGKLDESIKVFEYIANKYPSFSVAFVNLGKIYKKKREFKKALSYFDRAVNLEPSNLLLQIEFGQLLIDAGNVKKAREIVNSILKDETYFYENTEISIEPKLGFLLLKLKEYDRLITLNLEYLAKDQKSAAVFNQLGMAYYNKGNFQQALNSYQKALKLEDRNPLSLSNLGTLNLTLFQIKKEKDFLSKAMKFYSLAIDSNPKLITALNGMAVAFSYSGDKKKAISYWERSLKINPEFTDLYFNLGLTYLKIGQKKKALNYFQHCRNKYSLKLSERELRQLDNLIKEAQ